MVYGDVLRADLAATQATDALVALVDVSPVDTLNCARASFPRPAPSFILLGFAGMGTPPALLSGRNLVRIGAAKVRIPLPRTLGMRRAKGLLQLLQTCFAAADVPIGSV